MNTDTLKLYVTEEEIKAALKAGEPVVTGDPEVIEKLRDELQLHRVPNRHERRKAAALARKSKKG